MCFKEQESPSRLPKNPADGRDGHAAGAAGQCTGPCIGTWSAASQWPQLLHQFGAEEGPRTRMAGDQWLLPRTLACHHPAIHNQKREAGMQQPLPPPWPVPFCANPICTQWPQPLGGEGLPVPFLSGYLCGRCRDPCAHPLGPAGTSALRSETH